MARSTTRRGRAGTYLEVGAAGRQQHAVRAQRAPQAAQRHVHERLGGQELAQVRQHAQAVLHAVHGDLEQRGAVSRGAGGVRAGSTPALSQAAAECGEPQASWFEAGGPAGKAAGPGDLPSRTSLSLPPSTGVEGGRVLAVAERHSWQRMKNGPLVNTPHRQRHQVPFGAVMVTTPVLTADSATTDPPPLLRTTFIGWMNAVHGPISNPHHIQSTPRTCRTAGTSTVLLFLLLSLRETRHTACGREPSSRRPSHGEASFAQCRVPYALRIYK